ncbi:TPA: host cell division inhibitor Icd-like protein [Escherichia coli]|nr:host cell division inhibitor Icd-like protein [Escherichia coli]HCP1509277.1 host cell division inhibitor Icd-like protein [Escherichia coli]
MNTGYTPEQGRGFVRPGETKKPCYRVFSGIKKAAPIRNRLSEQLTCCEKIGSVQGNYINRVTKRYNCRITGKTKATAEGRQWESYILERITNNATFAAGGQCVRFAPMTLGLTEGHYGECAGLLVGYSCPLALRRWRRLISPLTAVTINCALLSPSSKFFSKSATTSCGNLAFNCCDLLFVEPVAITESSLSWCDSVYTKKISEKGLKCDSLTDRLKTDGAMHQTTTPRSGGTLAGRLTTNDSKIIEVAMLNHTTHPQGRDSHNLNKYIWRFIALSTAQPRVIHIEATSEQEARQQSPAGCVMVFAARIRQEVRHA